MSRSDYCSKVVLLLLSGGCFYGPALAGQIASNQTHLSAEQLKQVDSLVTEGIDKEKTRDHKGAVELFNQALMLDRHSYRAYVNRAWSRKETADYEGAISDYSTAIRLKPNSCWVYVNRGWCYQKLNHQDKALADFNRAIKINPKYVYAYKHRGALLLKKGEYQSSLNDYNTVIALNPNGDKDLQTYLQPDFFSGGFEENQMKPTPANPPVKRSKPAVAESTESSGLTSTETEEVDIAKLNNRAALAIKSGRFKDAIGILEKLAHQNPDYDLARDNLSIAYNNQALTSARKDPEESISKFRSSLFYAPSEATARKNLEQMLKDTGKDPKDFKVRMALGDEARDKGDITSAFVEYTEALRLENTAELRSRLADVCMKLDTGIKVATAGPASGAKAKAASIFDATSLDATNGAEIFAKPSSSPEAGTKLSSDAAIASAKNAMKQSSFSVTLAPKSSTPMTIDSQQIVNQLTKLAQNPQIISQVQKLAQNPQVVTQVSKLTQNIQSQAKNGILSGTPSKPGQATQNETQAKAEQAGVPQVKPPQSKPAQVVAPQVKPPQPVQIAVPQAAAPQPVQAAVPQAKPPQMMIASDSQPAVPLQQAVKQVQNPPAPKTPESLIAQSVPVQSSPADAEVANSQPDRITFRSALTRMKRGLLIKGAQQPDPQQTAAPVQATVPVQALAPAPTQAAAPALTSAPAQASVPVQAAAPALSSVPLQETPPAQAEAPQQAFAAQQESVTAQPTPSVPILAPASDTLTVSPPAVKPPEAALLLGTELAPVDPVPPAVVQASVPAQIVAAVPASAAQPTPEPPRTPAQPVDLRKVWQQRVIDGDRFYKENNFSEAERSFKESATIAQNLGDSTELVVSLDKLAGVLLIQNRNHDAMNSLTQALDVRKRLLPPGHPNIGETETRLNFVRSRLATH